MPARIAGGPPRFIQGEDEAVQSPGVKQAPPDRSTRRPDLPCLSCSYFSYPPDSTAPRTRPPPARSNCQTVNAKPLTPFSSGRQPVFPEIRKNRRLAERPRHQINRSNLLDDLFSPDALHPNKPHHSENRLVYRIIRRMMKPALPSCLLFSRRRLLIIWEYHYSMSH